MKTDRFPRPIPILSLAALTGWLVIIMAFGGTALAASVPTITMIVQKDDNGTPDTSDDKLVTMATGYAVNKSAVDGQGNIYVTDAEMGIVYMFNSNGHLVRSYSSLYKPVGVAASDKHDAETDKITTTVFVSGISNGYRTVFMLNQAGTIKGYLKRLESDIQPIGFGSPNNITSDSLGNVYVADGRQNIVQKFDVNGILVKTFGPYPADLATPSDKYFDSERIGGVDYYKTMHKMIEPFGVAVANDELYIAFKERVDYLTTISDASCAVTATDSRCSPDTESSYSKYSNTSSAYNNWYSLGDAQVVAVIDMTTGQLKRKITVYPFAKSGASGYSYRLNDIAVDNNGRLYVGTNIEMRVFDSAVNGRIDASTPLTVTGFPLGNYMGVAYDNKYNRLIASGGNTVSLFGIDCPAGICPKSTNNAPEAPALISPVSPASPYALTLSPILEVRNAIDPEVDPLTYSYEIKDSSGALISSSVNVVEGVAGMTYMPVSSTLIENSLYRWRAQSFDGNFSTWSAGDWETDKNNWAEFCVNAQNDKPETPVLTNPVSGAFVSPFSSYLSWSPSKDPDCYDTVSYVVEISADPYFGSILSSRAVNDLSIKFGGITTGMVNGSTYYWRVKAVDNNGGETSSNIGSFTYRTTVVKFESDQPGAKVFIDGNYGYFGRLLGTASLTVEGINPGSHFVTFVKAGYEPVHKIINVADPLDNESLLTVTAGAEEWLKASRIKPAAAATELFRTSGNSTPFIVDYNNDGLKDVIAGDADGNVYLYLSEVQMEGDLKKVVLAAQGAIKNINVGSNSAPFVVDYNNDGKKDLLVGAGDGLIYLHINGGTDHLPAFTSAETIKDNSGFDVRMSNSAPAIVDYNSDGKKDLVLGGAEGTLSLYINIGTDAAPDFGVPILIKTDNSELNLGPNINSKVFFTDWNNDGKKDMVVGGDTLHLFLNVGTDAAPDFRSIAALQDWIKDKKRERGNREFIPYLGYNQDLTGVVGVSTGVAPFVVNWDRSSARDIITGAGDGTVIAHVTPE